MEAKPPATNTTDDVASWDTAALSAWLAQDDVQLPPTAIEACTKAGVDGATALEMDKGAWEEAGLTKLQSAKVVARLKQRAATTQKEEEGVPPVTAEAAVVAGAGAALRAGRLLGAVGEPAF